MDHTAARRHRALLLVGALLAAPLAGACSDDDEKPIGPGTGEDLESPQTTLRPPSSPPQ